MPRVEVAYTFQPAIKITREEAKRIRRKAYHKLYSPKGILGKNSYERLGKGKIMVFDAGKAAKAIVLLESYGFIVAAELKPQTARDTPRGAQLYREASNLALEVANLLSQGRVDEALSKAYEMREKLVHAHLISTSYYGSITALPHGYETIEGALIKLIQQHTLGKELNKEALKKMQEALKTWSKELTEKAKTIETLLHTKTS